MQEVDSHRGHPRSADEYYFSKQWMGRPNFAKNRFTGSPEGLDVSVFGGAVIVDPVGYDTHSS